MKAVIKNAGPNSFVIALEPETAEDKEKIHEMALKLDRGHMINCRGFKYMKPDVEFYIQQMPRND